MSDLIDRQNAIDVLEILADKMSDEGKTVMAQAVAVLKDLQSEELERKKGEWICPQDKLPEHQQRYLVTIKTHKRKIVRSGTYFGELFMNDNGDIWKSTDKEVTAWMPLPEPWGGDR